MEVRYIKCKEIPSSRIVHTSNDSSLLSGMYYQGLPHGRIQSLWWNGTQLFLMLFLPDLSSTLHKFKSLLFSQIVGAFWYLLAIEREDACWRTACLNYGKCNTEYLYCGNENLKGFLSWSKVSAGVFNSTCSINDKSPFDFGIYTQALSSGIFAPRNFLSKFCYCLWWGLQNLR